MNLKQRVAFNVTITFALVIGASFISVYFLFASFRKEDFTDRLEKKAKSTARLLLEIQEIDQSLLYRIEKDAPYKMWKECIVIQNQKGEVIFSSLPVYDWLISSQIQERIVGVEESYLAFKTLEIVGLKVKDQEDHYIIYIAAEDKFGKIKLDFLKYVLLGTFVVSVLVISLSTSKLIKRLLSPLDKLQEEIDLISTKNLHQPILESGKKDEIDLLKASFNEMLGRIDEGYKTQANFTSHASHELRTPISRILFQLENLLIQSNHTPETIDYIKAIKRDAFQTSDLISSLLTLARIDRDDIEKSDKIRIDEAIFEAYDEISVNSPDFKFEFDIVSEDVEMELLGSKSLLLIAFSNLFRNAYLYSNDKKVIVNIGRKEETIVLTLKNESSNAEIHSPMDLLEPFVRGRHNSSVQGSGLGLGIVKRIVEYHNGKIDYRIENGSRHIIELIFPIF
ncbi:MAG: HAMP domain-containing protein [Bacteroidetes bacterium]|nr:HAMP domain-containing protein [Bacteroidota bacterium]